jgi:hypothetical protein
MFTARLFMTICGACVKAVDGAAQLGLNWTIRVFVAFALAIAPASARADAGSGVGLIGFGVFIPIIGGIFGRGE